MKKKQQVFLVIAIIMLVVFCVISCASAPLNSAKILIQTPIYSDTDFESQKVVNNVAINEEITLVGEIIQDVDGYKWQKISYYNYEGYIPYSYIYFTVKSNSYNVQIVKATSTSMGEKINIYRLYDENSEIVGTFSDGEKVNLIVEQSSDYGDFCKIVYNDNYYFVKKVNLTANLSYNQKLAVIIFSGSFVALLAAGIVIIFLHRKHKHKK